MPSYEALDRLADSFIPLFALALLGALFWRWRARALGPALGLALLVGLVQQTSKAVQKSGVAGTEFPSTHFAVALALATSWWLLGPRAGIGAAALTLAYGGLMLVQRYHAPVEMAASFFAVPVMLLGVLACRAWLSAPRARVHRAAR